MTTKLDQLFANLKAAIIDVKKLEGDTNKIDSFNEINKIGELLANAKMEIGDVLEKEQADLKKQENVLPYSQYTKKEKELREKQKTAESKIEEVRNALNKEKETMAAALPKYQYYDDSDGQVKDIKNLHKVCPDGGYEVKSTTNADGSYAAKVFNASGKESGMKLYDKDGKPYTDMEKVAEYFELKTDGFFNRLKAIAWDLIPFNRNKQAGILAELSENEYVNNNSVVYRWNEESAQFDEVRSYSIPNPYEELWGSGSRITRTVKAYDLDETIDNLTGSKSLANLEYEKKQAEHEAWMAEAQAKLDEIRKTIDE